MEFSVLSNFQLDLGVDIVSNTEIIMPRQIPRPMFSKGGNSEAALGLTFDNPRFQKSRKVHNFLSSLHTRSFPLMRPLALRGREPLCGISPRAGWLGCWLAGVDCNPTLSTQHPTVGPKQEAGNVKANETHETMKRRSARFNFLNFALFFCFSHDRNKR
jgi:hypothetical protein